MCYRIRYLVSSLSNHDEGLLGLPVLCGLRRNGPPLLQDLRQGAKLAALQLKDRKLLQSHGPV